MQILNRAIKAKADFGQTDLQKRKNARHLLQNKVTIRDVNTNEKLNQKIQIS